MHAILMIEDEPLLHAIALIENEPLLHAIALIENEPLLDRERATPACYTSDRE